jgi:ribosomal protein S18 acetylase RimI-like enzyme
MQAELKIRVAQREDLPAIVRMLADDQLGSTRESASDPLPPSYYAAFDAITRDPNNHLLVATLGDAVVGTLQLTFTPSLSYQGGWRATVESVRADASLRGQGIGTALMQHAIEMAREKGCVLMQLSTHKTRTDAHRFYDRLGFSAGHIGMKLMLDR